jgi:hypothetical protein
MDGSGDLENAADLICINRKFDSNVIDENDSQPANRMNQEVQHFLESKLMEVMTP